MSVLLGLAASLLLGSSAHASSLCDEQMGMERLTGGLWSDFVDRVARSVPFTDEDDESESPTTAIIQSMLEKSEYWVTIRHGAVLSIDCKLEVDQSVYLPLGIMIQPETTVHIQGHGDMVWGATEYGLNVLVPLNNLAPINRDHAYYFANDVASQIACPLTPPDADGARSPIAGCDPMAATPPAGGGHMGFSATSGYVYGPVDPEIESRLALFRQMRRGSAAERPDGHHDVCGVFAAGHVFRNRAPAPAQATRDRPEVGLSLCAATQPNGGSGIGPDGALRLRAIKVVHSGIAEQRFSHIWQSWFHRHTDHLGTVISTMHSLSRPLIWEKQCRQELTAERFQTVGLSGGLAIPDYIKWIHGSTRFSVDARSSFDTEFGRGTHFIIASHFFDEGRGPEDDAPFPLFDIWIVSECGDDRKSPHPSEAVEIAIYHPMLGSDFIRLDPHELSEDYVRVNAQILGDQARGIAQQNSRNLEHGVIWQFDDSRDYFFWRAALRRSISSDFEIRSVVTRNRQMDREFIIDYFVHLIMAAVFDASGAAKAQS